MEMTETIENKLQQGKITYKSIFMALDTFEEQLNTMKDSAGYDRAKENFETSRKEVLKSIPGLSQAYQLHKTNLQYGYL